MENVWVKMAITPDACRTSMNTSRGDRVARRAVNEMCNTFTHIKHATPASHKCRDEGVRRGAQIRRITCYASYFSSGLFLVVRASLGGLCS